MKNKIKLMLIISTILLFTTGCFEFSFKLGDEEATEIEKPENEVQTYEDTGYTINYPNDWIYEKPQDHIVIFSGETGTEAYNSTVNVQIIELGALYNNLEDLYEDYSAQINSVNGTISNMNEDYFIQNEETFNSISFYSEYEDTINFKQFIVVIDREDGYLQQLNYTSPKDIYEKYENIALEIINSVKIK